MDACSIGEIISDSEEIERFRNQGVECGRALRLPPRPCEPKTYSTAFSIRAGHARYGDKEIFSGFNWEVRKGERWMLYGHNGSGKSLLLSMVCADNPQGYSNDITLFDRRRGTGESIWEIKDNIGYVCPEAQLYFRSLHTVRDILVQGMRNALNRYRPVTENERTNADEWLDMMDLSHLADRRFNELSSGEQRLVLLARAFVRQPELLVLDEPFQGLDAIHKERIRLILDTMVYRNESTLILVTHYPEEIPSCITLRKEMPGLKV